MKESVKKILRRITKSFLCIKIYQSAASKRIQQLLEQGELKARRAEPGLRSWEGTVSPLPTR